nr:Gag-Pol polyprotein [Tanacetum cinerariifolium]
MQKNLALIAKYFKEIYKPTNNNLKTSLNSRNKNVDMTLRKPKRVKDSTYHKEKMLLCKQAKKGVPLQAEQYDWLVDTDEEIDEQELEAHYSYMAKIQNDQNDVESDDERVALANLKLDSNSIRDSCLVALQNKQIKFEKYMAFNDYTVDYDKLELWNEQASNVFRKEREQHIKIQDLKAQLQDKNISISELKKLIEKGKVKSMETKFDKPSVIRQPNAQRIPKPSVLDAHVPSQQELDLLFCPLYDEFFTAGCIDTRKSTSGGIQFLGDKLVSWMSKKKDCTAMSSAEAEYVALCSSNVDEDTTLRLWPQLQQHTVLLTEYQLADMFTKALPEDRFKYLVRRIEMSETSVANDTSGLVPQRQKALDYDNSDPVPQLQNVSSLVDAHVPSQQELDLLFGPLYDKFFTAGSSALGSSFGQTAFSDADHAGCIDTRKSTSGGIQFLGDKLVSWMSKKKDCTAMSLAEAEYVATEYQLADMFTKALPEDRFKYLVRLIGMRCLTPAKLDILAKESA